MPAEAPGPDHATPPTLHHVHTAPGRARLRLAAPMSRTDLGALADRLAAVPHVLRVVARPNTASVIVHTDGPPGPVLDAIAGAGIARIARAPNPPPVRQVTRLGMMRLDAGIRTRSGDILDLRMALVLLLMGAAILQAARGRVAGPATTLAMTAFALLDRDGP